MIEVHNALKKGPSSKKTGSSRSSFNSRSHRLRSEKQNHGSICEFSWMSIYDQRECRVIVKRYTNLDSDSRSSFGLLLVNIVQTTSLDKSVYPCSRYANHVVTTDIILKKTISWSSESYYSTNSPCKSSGNLLGLSGQNKTQVLRIWTAKAIGIYEHGNVTFSWLWGLPFFLLWGKEMWSHVKHAPLRLVLQWFRVTYLCSSNALAASYAAAPPNNSCERLKIEGMHDQLKTTSSGKQIIWKRLTEPDVVDRNLHYQCDCSPERPVRKRVKMSSHR